MKVVPPKQITDAMLLSSSVPETDYTEWSAATAYVAGDYCMTVANHTIYKCLLPHTNAAPADNVSGTTPKWYEVGKTNRWRMFDNTVASITSAANSITVKLDATLCDTVALFNVNASSVDILVKDSDGITLHSESVELLYDVYSDWADIFFIMPELRGNVYRTIPLSLGSTVEITFHADGATASCGHCVIGKGKWLGKSRYGLQIGITDYSKKSINDYGEAYLAQGNYADTCECDLWIDASRRAQIKSFLKDLRATGVVWMVDNKDEVKDDDTLFFGFYEDFSVTVQGPRTAGCNISIQGLV